MRLRPVPCDRNHVLELYSNPLLNQGCILKKHHFKHPFCGVAFKIAEKESDWNVGQLWPEPLKHICERAYATEAMHFALLGLSITLLLLGFLMLRKRGEKFGL